MKLSDHLFLNLYRAKKGVTIKKYSNKFTQAYMLNKLKELDLPKSIDSYFEIQRREHIAAAKIQTFWKRTKVLIPWRRAAQVLRMIVKIQKYVRGMVTRKFVAEWFNLVIIYYLLLYFTVFLFY